MKNIVLIGMPASGKTIIGKYLSEKMSYDYIDVDQYIEKKENKKISEIFFESGEEKFRELEKKYIVEISKKQKTVISTGGGVVKNKENIIELKKNGIIIFIDRNLDEIVNSDHSERPLLKNVENVYKIYKERIELYKKYCDIEIKNNDKIEIIIDKIIIKLNNNL